MWPSRSPKSLAELPPFGLDGSHRISLVHTSPAGAPGKSPMTPFERVVKGLDLPPFSIIAIRDSASPFSRLADCNHLTLALVDSRHPFPENDALARYHPLRKLGDSFVTISWSDPEREFLRHLTIVGYAHLAIPNEPAMMLTVVQSDLVGGIAALNAKDVRKGDLGGRAVPRSTTMEEWRKSQLENLSASGLLDAYGEWNRLRWTRPLYLAAATIAQELRKSLLVAPPEHHVTLWQLSNPPLARETATQIYDHAFRRTARLIGQRVARENVSQHPWIPVQAKPWHASKKSGLRSDYVYRLEGAQRR